jgi:adenylate cyclase
VAVEIERKFLVKVIPSNEIIVSKNIKQGYIVNDKHQVVRVRKKGDEYFVTIKGNTIGLSRLEFEYPIPKEDADDMFKHLCGCDIIEKTRHYVHYAGHTWEIDEFHGRNQGLIVAEIELGSEREKFELPDWIGNEVTQDLRYYNMNLTTLPFLDWKK